MKRLKFCLIENIKDYTFKPILDLSNSLFNREGILSLAEKMQIYMNKFALDTNILIYSHDKNAIDKQNIARELIVCSPVICTQIVKFKRLIL
jgi:hypothetical protein